MEETGGALDLGVAGKERVFERRRIGHRSVERRHDANRRVEPFEGFLLDDRRETLTDAARPRVLMDDQPEAAGRFLAVVESLPYRKDDDCYSRDWQTFTYLAERGIAGVRVDIRGTGASDGVALGEYLSIEQDDNLAVLEWLAEQPWCTGRLGMWGISWGGFSALQTAMLRPPMLQAICAMHATHDRFATDVHYIGGALHLFEQVDWPVGMAAQNLLPPTPPSSASVGRRCGGSASPPPPNGSPTGWSTRPGTSSGGTARRARTTGRSPPPPCSSGAGSTLTSTGCSTSSPTSTPHAGR